MFIDFPDIIILAGGLGTRLKDAIQDLPKAMAPINGKPFLEYLFHFIDSQNFQKVILSTGYRGNLIRDHFRNKFDNIDIEYSEEDEPLGTGGAIKLAVNKVCTPYFIVMNGDTFFNINLQKLFQVHIEHLAKLTIAMKEVNNASRYGKIELNNNGIITRFNEKSEHENPGLINGGTYILNTRYFKKLQLPDKFSFETDFLQKEYIQGDFRGHSFNNYFLDIGVPEDYKRAQHELQSFNNR